MATGISKTFTLEYNGFTVEVTVSETYELLKNTSDVSVGVRAKSAYKKGIQYLSGSIKIDGTALVTMNSTVSTHNLPITAYNTWYKVVKSSDKYTDSPWTMAGILHDTDGSKTITLDLEIRAYDAGGYLSFKVTDSRSVTLTHIPRASTVGASDANIGAVSTLSVVRRSTAYTHTIAYKFGALSGYIQEDGSVSSSAVKLTATSIPFLLPDSFCAQIPDSPTGECSLTIKTYSGSTQIGDAQTAAFTVTAAKSKCAPTVSGTVADTNAATLALTGDENILVRYVSDALCAITAEAKNSAAITAKTIGGTAVTGDTRTISDIQTGSVVFGCTDSRGYSASATVKKTLVPYIHLTANVTAKRTDPTSGKATLTITGKVYNGSFGASDNALTVQYAINGGDPITVEAMLDGNTYKVEAALTGLDYQSAHTIEVTLSDKLETLVKSVTVGKGIPVFDWGENDFQFHVPVYVQGVDILALIQSIQSADAGSAD